MDTGAPSSPVFPSSGLPRSSMSFSTPRSARVDSPARRTVTIDPLALGDENSEADATQDTTRRRKTRALNQLEENVPPVKDATGEKVMEGFEEFLKTFAWSFIPRDLDKGLTRV